MRPGQLLPPIDPNLAPTVADADNERRIEHLRRQLAVGCSSVLEERLVLNEMQDRIGKRSPAMVRVLERMKGLAA